MSDEIKQFEVSVKAFLLRDGALLMLRQASGIWELPGGRYHVGEENRAPGQVLERELREELGSELRYVIGKPVAAWTLPWWGDRTGEHVFVLGYRCQYVSGEIHLSDEHTAYQWTTPEGFGDLKMIEAFLPVLETFWARERNE